MTFGNGRHRLSPAASSYHISFPVLYTVDAIWIIFHHNSLISSISAFQEQHHMALWIVTAATNRDFYQNMVIISIDTNSVKKHEVFSAYLSFVRSLGNHCYFRRFRCIVSSNMFTCCAFIFMNNYFQDIWRTLSRSFTLASKGLSVGICLSIY